MSDKTLRVGLLSTILLAQAASAAEPLIFKYKYSTIMREGSSYYIETVTPAQAEISIYTYGILDKNCRTGDLNVKMLRIHTPPKHGVVCYKRSGGLVLSPINDLWFKCKNEPLRGVEFIYYPNPGYSGVDYLELGYIDPRMPRSVFSIKVVISEPYGKETSPPTQQEQGMLRECAPLVS